MDTKARSIKPKKKIAVEVDPKSAGKFLDGFVIVELLLP